MIPNFLFVVLLYSVRLLPSSLVCTFHKVSDCFSWKYKRQSVLEEFQESQVKHLKDSLDESLIRFNEGKTRFILVLQCFFM